MLSAVILIIMICGIIYWVHKETNQTFAKPIQKVESVVKSAADVNDDGKVDMKDVVDTAKKAGKAAKITVEKVKKTAGRKKKNS
jgi:hypothetical protein